MSGSGPFGPIFSGVWQSLQPPMVTRYCRVRLGWSGSPLPARCRRLSRAPRPGRQRQELERKCSFAWRVSSDSPMNPANSGSPPAGPSDRPRLLNGNASTEPNTRNGIRQPGDVLPTHASERTGATLLHDMCLRIGHVEVAVVELSRAGRVRSRTCRPPRTPSLCLGLLG